MPLFSVVIPTYNRASYIVATLQSVFAQTFQDFELIIADDGSTDDTLKVLESFRHRLRLLTQPNKGEGGARNLGMSAATGKYIAFIDSDDLWFPWTLETFAKAIDAYQEPTILFGEDIVFQHEREIQHVRQTELAAEVFPNYLSASRRLFWRGVNGNVFKRSAMLEIGPFSENRMVGLDIDYLLRLGTHRGFIRFRAPITFAYRMHGSNITQNHGLLHKGVRFMVDQERAGRYPGGPSRKWDRRRLIAHHARTVSFKATRAGHSAIAFDLYLATLAWNLRLGRFSYLLGLPFVKLASRAGGGS